VTTWTFIWLMVFLKIPVVALFLLVRWAVGQTPDEAEGQDGGIGPLRASAPAQEGPPWHPVAPCSAARARGHGAPAPAPHLSGAPWRLWKGASVTQ
jgi:hypothetical protein